MAPRPGLSESLVVETAIRLVDQDGLDSLSIANLAEKLKVRPPSLYNHIDGLDGLRRALTLHSLRELTEDLRQATVGRAGYEALVAMSQAYRTFAKRHPGLYPLTFRSPETGDEALQAAGRAAVEVVLAVLRAYHLADDEALHATRCLRSALHGFVSLETGGGFGMPLDIDRSFERLLAMLDAGLRQEFKLG
jgi:AcrR family transcriptional regulator